MRGKVCARGRRWVSKQRRSGRAVAGGVLPPGHARALAFPGGEDSMSGFLTLRWPLLGAGVIGLAVALAACGSSGGGAAGGGSGKKAYMLLPNTTTVRFVTQDVPKFKAAMERALPGTQVTVQNAEGDANKQVQQVETAISGGADAIVLVAADPFIAGGALQKAQQAKVPVILFDHDAHG